MNHPPILIHFNELGDRLAVWNSINHPDNFGIKEDLKELGYSIETRGNVYSIADPIPEYNNLSRVKIALEGLYGVSKEGRSDEALHEKENSND